MEYNLYKISTGTMAGIAVAFLLGIALAAVLHRRQVMPLGRSAWTALAAVSAAAVLMITLAPTGRGVISECVFTMEGPLFGWVQGNQSTANVALMVPLGIALPLAARTTRWHPWSVLLLFAFPVLVEVTQRCLPIGRACDLEDVVDNWFGAAFGWLFGWAGTAAVAAASTWRRQPAPER